jgi:2-oxoglutarate dehydrogenase E2 component (dihydrolipoamide succinyltransferase)
MRIEVKVPQLPESVAEATLVTWHKKPGDGVARDENLIDIETDKVVLELPAPADGVIAEIVKPDGATVTSGDIIAVIDTEAKGAAAAASAAPKATEPKVPAPAAPPAPTSAAAPAASATVTALPAARKILADQGVDPARVEGTGRGGRITKGDALAAVEAKAAPAPSAATPAAKAPPAPAVALPAALGSRPEQRVPMSRLRQRVAERLVQSQHTAAILTTFNEVNMQPVIDLRNRYKERFEKEHGVKLGFMSFFVKAAVHALKKYPLVNASIDGTDIVYHGYYDIGIAVGSPRGLVVPILRDADQMSIADIEKQVAEYGKRAQDGKLTVEELTGGTYTISNGGVFGSMLSTPIINPPQSAILGVHATKDRAVVENGQIVVRPMNYLAQSYDHRIIDGREAVLSLVAIKEALEDPARLLLDILGRGAGDEGRGSILPRKRHASSKVLTIQNLASPRCSLAPRP